MGSRKGFYLEAEQKGEFSRASVSVFLSVKDVFFALQANTKFNSRWTTDEQLLAVQGGLDYEENRGPQESPHPPRSWGQRERIRK